MSNAPIGRSPAGGEASSGDSSIAATMFLPTGRQVLLSHRSYRDKEDAVSGTVSRRGTGHRWLPAGDSRSLPRLDAEVAGRTAAGENVQVVYSARGDRFMIVAKPEGRAA